MGFLSSMLPTIAGAGLMAASGGAINPLTAGLILGGLQTARTGSLQKGIMAGIGAYGGAGLASGLAGAGASAMNTEAAKNIATQNPELMASEVGREMGQAGFSQPQLAANVNPATASMGDKFGAGISNLGNGAFTQQMGGNAGLMRAGLAAASPMMAVTPQQPQAPAGDSKMPQRLQYNQGTATPLPAPDVPDYGNLGQDFGRQRNYFPGAGYQNITDEQAKQMRGYATGGTIEQMSTANAVGANTGYPMADIQQGAYATPYQTPVSQNVVAGAQDVAVDPYTGQEQRTVPAPVSRLARGGLSAAASHLGDYSDGGRLLKGPGDGVSDSIPATIGNKRPARLADGEFVVPARIVSELGNGSTDAGARKLYAMLDRVQAARKKSIGKGKVAKNSRADKLLPA